MTAVRLSKSVADVIAQAGDVPHLVVVVAVDGDELKIETCGLLDDKRTIDALECVIDEVRAKAAVRRLAQKRTGSAL